MASITGWGRGAWSEGAWNAPLPVSVTGVSASGDVGGVFTQNTGLYATGYAGSVGIATDQVLTVTGVEATGGVGVVTVSEGQGATAVATGVSSAGVVGVVSLATDQVLTVTGVEATSAVGTPTQRTTQVIPVSAPSAAVSAIGTVSTTGDASVYPTGLQSSGEVERVLVWGQETTSPTTVWTEIEAA